MGDIGADLAGNARKSALLEVDLSPLARLPSPAGLNASDARRQVGRGSNMRREDQRELKRGIDFAQVCQQAPQVLSAAGRFLIVEPAVYGDMHERETPPPAPPRRIREGSQDCRNSVNFASKLTVICQTSQVDSTRNSFPPLLWGD